MRRLAKFLLHGRVKGWGQRQLLLPRRLDGLEDQFLGQEGALDRIDAAAFELNRYDTGEI